MPSYTTWFVEVVLHTKDKLKSPGFKSREDADAALAAIREAQKSGDWLGLDWLSVKGSDILVANITSSSVGVF